MTSWVEGLELKALSCGKPANLVVLLAESRGDVQTMLDLALGWAPAMPKADFVMVQLPSASIGDGGEAEWAAGLDLLLDEMLARRRLSDSHLALVGFSEGATLALRVGLRRQTPIAALVAISACAFDMEALLRESRAQPPILLVHSDADAVSPLSSHAGLQGGAEGARRACLEFQESRPRPSTRRRWRRGGGRISEPACRP